MKYEMLIYIGFIGGIITLLVNIYLFIKLNIKKVFMDLTGLTVQKEMKEIISKNKYPSRTARYREKHAGNKNDTALMVKDLARRRTADISTQDTQILSEDTIEETTILTEECFLDEKAAQEDFVILKDITVVHTQESIADMHNLEHV